ncbi:MAG: tRNA pseudouridine(38-40) synthase TruA, partial [Candidatus Cryptobacteroides sp.]
MRYRLRISYDGAPLSGWQCQNNAPSVQEEVSKALSTLLGGEIQVTGAGRTDAGVNAVNYIAHFDAPSDESFDTGRIEYKLNAILPRNIVVHELSP